ncbi:urate oxidase, partial [Catenulispora sp. NF23]|uniref:factor-independent urate hydroxylase n=1 Tax=Catenulispora pinistramenti TaxID=2705254 RepID=UPI001BA527CB
MSIVLGDNRYGKAENRVVRITKEGPVHQIKDLTVSVALSGDLDATHLTGDNSGVLPTDTMKNTCFAFAQRHGAVEIEDYALLLARHFVDSQPSIAHARVAVAEHPWERIAAGPHSFLRAGGGTRTCTVHYDGTDVWVVSGLKDLTVLNSTDSEFWGYVKDEYTTLVEADDRILATEIHAQWRHTGESGDWGKSYERAKNALLEAFVRTHSRSLQQTLFEMGTRVLEEVPELCEVRLKLPNKHHFRYDTAPFGLDNPNETFLAADRPYGLIEGDVRRDDAPDAGPAWT